jgi:hypothetical protein
MHPSRYQFQSAALWVVLAATPAAADWRDDIGFTRLQTIAGAELPLSPSQGLTQVEAFDTNNNYTPDTGSPSFAGKTFTVKSGASGISGHANKVGVNFYGTTSQLPGIAAVDLYNADDWLDAGFLKRKTLDLPGTESRAVQNHSWISTGMEDAEATEANHRLDYAIQNQGFICVVGQNNDASNPLPQLLGQGYHSISVGRSDGQHSAGPTTLDGSGRIKPDLVAPSAFPDDRTSWTTPMVAGAAGLLHAKVSAAPYSLTGANLPRVVKALLMASARKDNLAGWSNTSTRPLDLRFGAGNLNVHHAYLALRAGKAAASGSISHGIRGWAAESVGANTSKTWFVTIPAGAPATPFCAALTWHRVVTTGISGSGRNQTRTWDSSLHNLNLRLYQANGFTLGSEIAASLSAVDNVELIHQPALPPGNYAIEVENTSDTAIDIALAWHSLPPVSIAATQPVAKEINGQQATLTLTRGGDTTLPLQVPLALGGNAVAGAHYQPLPATVTIPAGKSSLALQVTPIADSLAQGNRSLSVAVAADFALVRDPAQSAVITIQDKPFDAWRFSHFSPTELANPAISGETADPDGDDLDNLIEYALGLPPESADPSPAAAAEINGYLAITFNKSPIATDITWNAQVCGDFSNWQPAVIVPHNDEGVFTARDFILRNDADHRFIRLKITRP